MSRSGYSYDLDESALNLWRGAVESSIRGKRGQLFLRETLAALDAMTDKRLVAEVLVQGGDVCAMGATAKARGIDMTGVDETDRDAVASKLNIAPALAAEIAFMNDEGHVRGPESPEQRFIRMRKWVAEQIIEWEPPVEVVEVKE
jgi:hypothetical protein